MTYTVLWSCMVFRQQPSQEVSYTYSLLSCFSLLLTSLKLFYASQIALQSVLAINQGFQASISMRVLGVLGKKSGKICMILASMLGLCAVILACVPPSVTVGRSAHTLRPEN